ncbi:MAG: hypothetical protein A2W17_07920 [Planctomycetes bacterium RBG_16_41_13]|nr:MAG: hypothetical protein A2W17_07920 [Planctomycetes bacterium RBG_16_41_13]
MFEGIFLEKEIKEKLSELKEIDKDMYDYLLNKKIEFNKFKVLKRTVEQTIKRYLARILGYQKAAIKEYPMKFIEEYKKRMTVKELIDNINRPSHKKKIVYVTGSPTYNIVRQSICLRKEGYETILLMETNLSFINFLEKHFDIVYVFNSIYTLSYIIKEAKPYLIHVQGATPSSNHFGILAKLLSNSKVVFNFNDIPSTAIVKEDIESMWNKEDVKLDLFSERFACERCDGLIFGYSAEVRERIKSRYPINIPMLEFHSYPCDEFMSEDSGKYSDRDGKVHIVQGGMVAPSHTPEKFKRDGMYYKLIEVLTRQGICFDMYVVARRIKRDYEDYISLSEKNPLFRFNGGLLLDQATKEFGKYDFGAILIYYDEKKAEIFYKRKVFIEENRGMRVSDRFFTYLEAGLPILISDNYLYGAMLVKEYGMGIVVSKNDLNNLSEIINSYDREKLRGNVKRARQELSMKRHIGRLIAFYEQVVEGKYESKL